MPDTEPPEDPFASTLLALASGVRLQILRELRTPRILKEIVVSPDGHTISRQAVRRHLDTLLEAGLVQTRGSEREHGEATEFSLNHQRLFDASEQLRALARMRPAIEPHTDTVVASGDARATVRGVPGLLVVKGADEGAFHALDPASGAREWIVGRKRGVAVPLDYDATVSQENARILWTGDEHWVEDVLGSRNGTRVNLRPLAAGARARLARGDLLTVGRTSLLYWT